MRTGEEILAAQADCEVSELLRGLVEPSAHAAIRAIESAQREAWNEAVVECAKAAQRAEALPGFPLEPGDRVAFIYGRDCAADSIRSLHREEE